MSDGRERPRILIADDDPLLLTAYRRGLQDGLAYDIRTVGDGEAVLGAFDELQPDLVLLDLLMPRRSGFEVCRVLKSRPDSTHVPICALSAMGDEPTRRAALAAGADDFLSKPFEIAELRLRVQVLVKRKVNADFLHSTAVEMERWRREHEDLVNLLVHDLRGPLSAIASATAFLERSENASDRQFLVTVLKDGVKRLDQGLENLTTRHQLASARAIQLTDELDVNAVVHTVAAELQRVLALREQRLELALSDAPQWIAGDAVLLHQLVSNLLLNAVEYAPAGSAIRATTATVGASVELAVEDHGAAIPAELVHLILESTAHGALKRNGVRVGRAQNLVVLDMAATLHGGDVRFERPADGGLRVVVTLPERQATAANSVASASVVPLRLAVALGVEIAVGSSAEQVRTVEISEEGALLEPHPGLTSGMTLAARFVDIPGALCSARVLRSDASGVEVAWTSKTPSFSGLLSQASKCRVPPEPVPHAI